MVDGCSLILWWFLIADFVFVVVWCLFVVFAFLCSMTVGAGLVVIV